jgi:hypothetical protein
MKLRALTIFPETLSQEAKWKLGSWTSARLAENKYLYTENVPYNTMFVHSNMSTPHTGFRKKYVS